MGRGPAAQHSTVKYSTAQHQPTLQRGNSVTYTLVTWPEVSQRTPVQPEQGAEAAVQPTKELELLTVAKLVMFPLNCNSAEAAKTMSSVSSLAADFKRALGVVADVESVAETVWT